MTLRYYHNESTGEDTVHAYQDGRRVGAYPVTPSLMVEFLIASTVPLEVERWVSTQREDHDLIGLDDVLLYSVEVLDRGTLGICRDGRRWMSRLNHYGVD